MQRAFRIALTGAVLSLALATQSRADCGDVTGDENTTAGDALAVLRRAVGQSVDLQCTYDGLQPQEDPNYDTKNLVSGFVPDPFSDTLLSGGTVPVTFLGNNCTGYVSRNPDYIVNYDAGGATLLRFYVESEEGDTTLVVHSPDQYYRGCDDDSYGTPNPTVDFHDPPSGRYSIWIGSYNKDVYFVSTLYVTELSGNHP